MGILKGCVFQLRIRQLYRLTMSKVKYPNQQRRPRHLSGLQPGHVRPGSINLPILKHRSRHCAIDESRAPRSEEIRASKEKTNAGIGLSCVGDGDIRNP